MNVYVLVPAAGSGKRLGSKRSKQFLQIGAQPILALTLLRLASVSEIDGIYIIAPETDLTYCQDELVEHYQIPKIFGLVAGGSERQVSVRNGLNACNAKGEDIVLIHDGVRPFFPKDQIPALIKAAVITGAATLAIPARDTIKTVRDGHVQQTLERNLLWQVQTPQAFRFSRILEAHNSAHLANHVGTDDAELVERCGWPVAIVSGSVRNFKITTQEDLFLARSLVAMEGADLL